jgi:hypothetical protein
VISIHAPFAIRAAALLLPVFAWPQKEGQASKPAELTKKEFQQLHAAIVPSKAELWETIPWRIDLLESRTEAFRQKKPIFLWAMNGHPLGCT